MINMILSVSVGMKTYQHARDVYMAFGISRVRIPRSYRYRAYMTLVDNYQQIFERD